jgi:GNAT superfamily N-acetyltransferase
VTGAFVTPIPEAPPPRPVERPATYGEVWDANRVLARGDRTDAEADRLRTAYEPVLSAVNADRARRGLKPMVNPGYWQGSMARRPSAESGPFDFGSILDRRVTRDEQQSEIFKELAGIRARDPAFLKGVPADAGVFQQGIIDREKTARAGARDVLGRSSGAGQTLAGFAAGTWETMHDPVNIASLPLGGGGKTILAQVARSALVNGALEALQLPLVAEGRAKLGEELTAGEAVAQVGMAAAGGVFGDVVVPQAAKFAGKAVGAAFDVAVPADRRIAMALGHTGLDDVSDHEIAAAFSQAVPTEIRTPDEMAAIHVITREGEVRAASPYVATPAGLDAHAARLQSTMEAILRTNTGDVASAPIGRVAAVAARGSPSLAPDIVDFFKAKGYSEAQARGIAAGVAAEAASSHTALNPDSGAIGLGQWLGPRKGELIRRYGPRPTRAEQLEFLHWELQGGDHGGRAVLAQGDEAAVLDAYIRKFMRPGAGAETSGDLSRGLSALGRNGEDVARALDAAPDGAPVARDPALDAQRVPVDLPEREIFEAPELRRDLFPDDGNWRIAQHAADADAMGVPPVAALEGIAARQAEPVEATVPQSAAGDDTLGPSSILGFQPEKGRPGISVMDDEGHFATAVFRDGSGRAQAAVQMPISPEALAITNEVSSYVRPEFRRQGIGSKLYDALDRAGYPVDRLSGSGDLTPEGAAFVNARRGRQATAAAEDRRAAAGARDGSPGAVAKPGIAASGAEGNAIARDASPLSAGDDPRALEPFADPHGDGAKLQADSLDHDARRLISDASAAAPKIKALPEQMTFRFEDGDERGLADVLAELDEDAAALAAIRECL